jgi:uridine kinase
VSRGVPALSAEVRADLVARIRGARPRLGSTVLVAVDGRSGAGKSTLAAALSEDTGALVVHLEDLYPGWDGLDAGVRTAHRTVLKPFARGDEALVPQWDWYGDRWGVPLYLSPPDVLILEGVGAASRVVRTFASLTVWLEVADDERLARARARGWDTYDGHWDRWAAQERVLLRREGLPAAADLVLGLPASAEVGER